MSTELDTINEHHQMVSDLRKDGQELIDGLAPHRADLWHMGTGIIGEASEITEELYSYAFGGNNLRIDNMTEELGDSEFFVGGIYQIMGIPRHAAPSNELITLDPQIASSLTMQLQIAAGYVFDWIKRYSVYNTDAEKIDKKLGKTFEECLYVYEGHLGNIRVMCGITRHQALEHNLDKLLKGKRARYKEGQYSDEQAGARQDKD